jgi:hypothetical protein
MRPAFAVHASGLWSIQTLLAVTLPDSTVLDASGASSLSTPP